MAFQLEVRPALQEGVRIWYCKPEQEHVAGEIIDPGDGPTAFALLNRRVVKVMTKYVYTSTSASRIVVREASL